MRSSIYRALGLAFLITTASAPASAQIYATDFSTLDGWTVTTDCTAGFAWAADATPAAADTYYGADYFINFAPYVSAPASLNFNDGVSIGAVVGPTTCGSVTSPSIDLSQATGVPVLRFVAGGWMELGCGWDKLSVRIRPAGGGATFFEQDCVSLEQAWLPFEYPLDSAWGSIEIEFRFGTLDGWSNGGPGVFIDDLEIIDRCALDAASPCEDFLEFCFGDGSGTACPCGNESTPGQRRGCLNSSGSGARLLPSGDPEVMNDTLRFQLEGAPAQSFAFLVSADNPLPMTAPGSGIQDRDGLRCVGGNLLRHGARATDLAGRAGFGTPGWGGMDNPAVGLIAQYGFVPGQSRYFQIFVRDDVNAVCGSGGNRSQGVKVTFQ